MGCTCVNCEAAKADSSQARTASSLLLVAQGQGLLLDTAPDLRHQWRHVEVPLAGIAWTHAHMGHVTGAALLGKEGPDLRVPGIGTPRLLQHVQQAAPHLALAWRALAAGDSTEVGPFQIRSHPINHRAETSDTVAIEVMHGERKVLYLPDTDHLDEAVEGAVARLRAGDALFFDATFWSKDELGHRRLQDIPHPPTLEVLPRLRAWAGAGIRVVLTHLNHTNPVLRPGPELDAVRAAGLHVAKDGQRIVLG